jgi:hypothetical protein
MSINNKILDIIWEPQITTGAKPIDPKEGDIYYDGRYNYIFESNKWNKFKVKLNPARRRINKIKNLYELR